MLAIHDLDTVEAPRVSKQDAGLGVHEPHTSTRTLAAAEILFQDGDTRARLYRVESGAICHYVRWDDGRHEVIEMAFPGDIIGLGNLEKHVSTAQAMVASSVSVVSLEEFERALEHDGRLAARLAAAADREFEVLRQRAVRPGAVDPVARLAAFLAAMSHMSAREGRDPFVIGDSMTCGVVAERLQMTVDGLSDALVELERRGLVAPSARGLRLKNVVALEALADDALANTH